MRCADVLEMNERSPGAQSEGAHRLFGGERVAVEGLEEGYYLSPCILTNVTRDMRVYKVLLTDDR